MANLEGRVRGLEGEAAKRGQDGRRVVVADGKGYLLDKLQKAVPLRKDVVEVRMYRDGDGFRFGYERRPDMAVDKKVSYVGSEINPHRDKLPEYFYFYKKEKSFRMDWVGIQHIAEAGGVEPVAVLRGDIVLDEAEFREYLQRIDDAVFELAVKGDEPYYLRTATCYYSDRYKAD